MFTQKRIEFLGVVLENNTIQMDPTKIKGVAEWPYPRNPTDVRSFLGFTGFYRYFIPNYSHVAQPLLDLTKKATPWIWTEAQTKAFETLKTLMCSKPVLTQPQYDKPFVVYTDASAYGVGAILLQEGEINPQNLRNHASTPSPTTQQCSHRLKETTISMNANCWLLSKLYKTGDHTLLRRDTGFLVFSFPRSLGSGFYDEINEGQQKLMRTYLSYISTKF